MKRKMYFSLGIIILLFLAISYFIRINTDQGNNYIVKSSLLGVIIFNNPFILGIYIFVGVILIIKSRK